MFALTELVVGRTQCTLGPTYNGFFYNEHPATRSNLLSSLYPLIEYNPV